MLVICLVTQPLVYHRFNNMLRLSILQRIWSPCSYHRRLEFVLSFNIICIILFACLSFTTNVFLEILQTFFRHWNEACFAHTLYRISRYLTTNNNTSLFLRYRGFRIPRGANAMEGPITSDIVLIGGNSHVELANLIAR